MNLCEYTYWNTERKSNKRGKERVPIGAEVDSKKNGGELQGSRARHQVRRQGKEKHTAERKGGSGEKGKGRGRGEGECLNNRGNRRARRKSGRGRESDIGNGSGSESREEREGERTRERE